MAIKIDHTSNDISTAGVTLTVDGTVPGGSVSTIGTDSAATYTDGQLFVSATGIAYWKLNDGAEGWYEVGPLLQGEGSYQNSIACGWDHTTVIKADGTVWACGYNDYGQLGDGTTQRKNTFVQSFDSNGIAMSAIAVSCGTHHTAAIKPDGTVWSVGRNHVGQLGDSTLDNRSYYVYSGISAIAVATGGYYTAVIKPNNEVWSVGENYAGCLGNGASQVGTNQHTFVDSGISAIAVACGSHHTMVIKPGIDNNEVWGAGHNSSGQLGIGSYVSQSTFVSSGNAFEAVSSAIAISCCAHAVHIIKADNTVWGAGANQSGQLSNGGTIKKYDFVQSLDSNSNAISALAVAGGALHTAVIKSDNTVWTVGYNNYGQLGQGHDGGSNVLFDSIDPVINGLYVHPEMIGVIDPSELP